MLSRYAAYDYIVARTIFCISQTCKFSAKIRVPKSIYSLILTFLTKKHISLLIILGLVGTEVRISQK